MPVTIGNATSNVSVVDSNNMLTEEMLEQIVNLVMARIKEEQNAEAELNQEGEIRDRMSDTEYF